MQIENGLSHFIAFCTCAARCETLDCNTETGDFIRKMLLASARHSRPVFNERSAADFDTNPVWSPAPRIDGAEGLMFLAFKPTCVDTNVVQEIVRLSKDTVPAVRLQIADHLGMLGKTSPDVAKELLSEMAKHDPSSTVLRSLLNHQIYRLASALPHEAERLTTVIFGRTDLKGEMAMKVRLTCVSLFFDLFLWRDNGASEALIRGFAGDVLSFTQEATSMVARIREVLVTGPFDPPDPVAEKARTRAFNILEAMISSAQNGFLTLRQRHQNVPFADWPKADKEKANSLAQLADSISMQLYFASGAFDNTTNHGQADAHMVSIEQKRRFLNEAGLLLDLLSDDPHPGTVHRLIQMLQSLLDISPREVFLRISRIVQAGKSGGYERESLAIGEIVNVVNTALADFRPLLQDDQEMREAMVSMLDIFVEAGWPQAIQLTYRLDEIFR
jgi:hypothetical protein